MLAADGRPVGSASPFSNEMLEADKRAFVALMRHLKKTDPQHTVIMVQVENESGTWGAIRDYSPAAQKAFDAPVPAASWPRWGRSPASPTAHWLEGGVRQGRRRVLSRLGGGPLRRRGRRRGQGRVSAAALRERRAPRSDLAGTGRQLGERRPDRRRAPDLEGGGAGGRHPGARHLHGRLRQGRQGDGALPAPRQSAPRSRDLQRARSTPGSSSWRSATRRWASRRSGSTTPGSRTSRSAPRG